MRINPLKPGIQAFSGSLAQHGGKVSHEVIDLLDLLIRLTQLSQLLFLPVQALFFFEGDPMSAPSKLSVGSWEEVGQGVEWQGQLL